jgi:hypothetical protein
VRLSWRGRECLSILLVKSTTEVMEDWASSGILSRVCYFSKVFEGELSEGLF